MKFRFKSFYIDPTIKETLYHCFILVTCGLYHISYNQQLKGHKLKVLKEYFHLLLLKTFFDLQDQANTLKEYNI